MLRYALALRAIVNAGLARNLAGVAMARLVSLAKKPCKINMINDKQSIDKATPERFK
jgi:hypothetical protein